MTVLFGHEDASAVPVIRHQVLLDLTELLQALLHHLLLGDRVGDLQLR